jgi:hypothetical protein
MSLESRTFSTAFSIAKASLARPNEYLSIIAAERIVATGFAIPVGVLENDWI